MQVVTEVQRMPENTWATYGCSNTIEVSHAWLQFFIISTATYKQNIDCTVIEALLDTLSQLRILQSLYICSADDSKS
jgi:hypothetical protein